MFKNYIRVILRHFRRQKSYAFINISGFALGMAACILILLYVLHELNYDRFHRNSDRIYRLGVEGTMNGNYMKYPLSTLGSGPTMHKDFPEVKNFVRVYPISRRSVKYLQNQYFESALAYADKSFFQVFSFNLIQGDAASALEKDFSVVLSEDMAKKYFGNENPLGKTLRFQNEHDYIVTGVMENMPSQSHLKLDFLCSISSFYAIRNYEVSEWDNFNYYTYLLLDEKADPSNLTAKFPDFIEQYLGHFKRLLGEDFGFFIMPLTDIHLRSQLSYDMPSNSDITYIYVFSSIALFILLIACINFMNLATARASKRAKEVGLRKVLGADKKTLLAQFLTESILYCALSVLIALLLVFFARPYFNNLTGIHLSLQFINIMYLIPALLGFTLFTGLVAGSYPALLLSSFQPVKILKGIRNIRSGKSNFRTVLVVGQFIISLSLMIGTSVMLNQLHYMKSKKLGFVQEQVVIIPIQNENIRNKLESIKHELSSHNSILQVSAASDVPGHNPDYSVFVPEGYTLEQTQLLHRINCDADFVPTMKMEIVRGRNFSLEFGTDHQDATIINETAAHTYGWTDPIGKKIGYFTDVKKGELAYRTVIGVVKDFHVASLHHQILPLLLTNSTDYFEDVVVRIQPEDISATLEFLQKKWQEYDPGRPFDYYFLDQRFNDLYQADERLNTIIRYFTFFAILVACLGLYGMASFMGEQRFKEIGIRKTLGASVSSILLLLSKEITRLILLAMVITIPISYYVMQRWLEGFAYRIDLNPMIFILAAVAVLLIGYVTIAYQSIRASLINPVDAIRTE
ncbi:MAG: ABC transporter permease [bacterium]|nr:MAG: ABC transporter permease [bacterium]